MVCCLTLSFIGNILEFHYVRMLCVTVHSVGSKTWRPSHSWNRNRTSFSLKMRWRRPWRTSVPGLDEDSVVLIFRWCNFSGWDLFHTFLSSMNFHKCMLSFKSGKLYLTHVKMNFLNVYVSNLGARQFLKNFRKMIKILLLKKYFIVTENLELILFTTICFQLCRLLHEVNDFVKRPPLSTSCAVI